MVRGFLLWLLVSFLSAFANAAEVTSSTLVGRVVARGDVPEQKLIKPIRDFKKPIPDETLVFNTKNRGIANVVIWLRESKDNPLPDKLPVDEKLDDGNEKNEISIRFFDGKAMPRVALVRTNQTLKIQNDDPVMHAPHVSPILNQQFQPLIPKNAAFQHKFEKAERVPIACTCPLHPWEKAYIVIKDHPYMAVTDADGKFQITNLPLGSWTFVLWHEKFGYLTRVFQNGHPKRLTKGRLNVDFKDAKVDLGTIEMFDLMPVIGKAESN